MDCWNRAQAVKLFLTHKFPERASILEEAPSNQVDEVTHSIDVNPPWKQAPWFLLSGSPYKATTVAGTGAICTVEGRVMPQGVLGICEYATFYMAKGELR